MAQKNLIVCDYCGQEKDFLKEDCTSYVKVEYRTNVLSATPDGVFSLAEVVRRFDFCCDDCAKKYIMENGFKKK
jgi:hypothetical protein